LLFVN